MNQPPAKSFLERRRGGEHFPPPRIDVLVLPPAVDLAVEARCRRLILFHHEPEHDDTALDALVADTRDYAERVAPGLVVEAAVEGLKFSL